MSNTMESGSQETPVSQPTPRRKPGRPKGSGHKPQIDQLRTDYDTLLQRVASLEAFVKRFFPIGGKLESFPDRT